MSAVWSDSTATAAPRRRRARVGVATPPRRVAILGFGTVGRSLASLIATSPSRGVRLTHIATRDVARRRVNWLDSDVTWSESLDHTSTARNVDIVVELLGGIEPALTCIRAAIVAGKSVVTANKQVMARHGAELFALAAHHGVELRCEAAAGGVVPIVRAMTESLRADQLTRFAAILNGTSNFVLERLERGASLADAVTDATRAGFAEADPGADLDGHDAAAKTALLSLFAFGVRIDADTLPRRSIAAIERADFVLADRFGFVLKAAAYARRTPAALHASVGPACIPRTSPLAAVTGARNAIVVSGEHSGETVFAGEGAGGAPTAVAVLSDVLSISRPRTRRPAAVDATPVPCVEPRFPHIVRLALPDRDRALPTAITALHAGGLDVLDVITVPGDARAAHVALRLGPCRTREIDQALATISRSIPFRGPAAVMFVLTEEDDVERG